MSNLDYFKMLIKDCNGSVEEALMVVDALYGLMSSQEELPREVRMTPEELRETWTKHAMLVMSQSYTEAIAGGLNAK